ncbi:MAG: RecX family transcriptional regulator [Bacteroidales bacterium]|jgi:regulatory protein|nr:RecX family transcriptional regulator [Bacteroidales bacterium]
MNSSNKPGPEVLVKIERFCAYQERCRFEVVQKLKTWGVPRGETDSIMEHLGKEGFINEERFAMAFVRGKFNHNKWGRQKIRYELKGRQIPEKIITLALEGITREEYLDMIRLLIAKKRNEIKSGKNMELREKIINFVTGKGFEAEIVKQVMLDTGCLTLDS